jgi:hypothetical protein
MTREHRQFFELASLDELQLYADLGGSVPREAWARARGELTEQQARDMVKQLAAASDVKVRKEKAA